MDAPYLSFCCSDCLVDDTGVVLAIFCFDRHC